MNRDKGHFLKTVSANQDAGIAQSSLAIVSPCSSCKNNLSMPSEQFPMCPRRHWQYRADQINANDSGDVLPPDYLLRKGRADDANGYENPVAWEDGQLRLVWCATLEENQALLNSDGTVANPDILQPNFDTRYITCRTAPYVPAVREGAYYGGEQLHEKDFVLVTGFKFPQMDQNDPNLPVRISGFVTKTTPLQKATITPAKRSVNPAGL